MQIRDKWGSVWAAAALALLTALPASAQTLERIAETGVLKIGYRGDARPFSYADETGEPNGFSVELCREIAADTKAKLGLDKLETEFVQLSTEDRFEAVVDGRVDILCGVATITLSRRERVAFSIPTFHTGITALMRADADAFLRDTLAKRQPTQPGRATLMQAFADRKFGARTKTTAEDWLRGSIDKLASNADLVLVESHDEGYRKVAEGELDAYFSDRAILMGLVMASDNPGDFLIGERLYTHEPYGLALTKGDEDFRLLVDRSLSRLYRTLEIVPIFSRHLGRPGLAVVSLYATTALPE